MRFLAAILLFFSLTGCAGHVSAPTTAGSKVTAAVTTVSGDIGSARQGIAAATATLADIAAMTGLPPGTAAMLVTLGAELSAADSPLARAITADLPSVGAEADAALALQEKQIADLQSKQHQWYLFAGALGAAVCAGLATAAIIEASMPGGTILLTFLAGGFVGAIVFAIAGYVLPDVAKTVDQEIKILLWGAGAVAALIVGWWIYNRVKTGSWGGALHAALAPKPTT